MKKGSHKCWKNHVFKLNSSRLVSRKLQKTRTSVMISSPMFGIFVINEAIENTCNLLKKRCRQSMIMSFAQATTSNDNDDFHGVMTTHEPWRMGLVSTDEWWVMTSVSTDEWCRTNTKNCWNCKKSSKCFLTTNSILATNMFFCQQPMKTWMSLWCQWFLFDTNHASKSVCYNYAQLWNCKLCIHM